MFYFVRHGQTDYSERGTGIYKGFGAELARLTPEGERQIRETAKDPRLSGADIIICSPYTRAMQTAAILSKELGADIAVETGLHEWLPDRDYGVVDEETAKRYHDEFDACGGVYPDGEERPWEDAARIKERVMKVLERYSSYGRVIVVAHGTMIRTTAGCGKLECGQIIPFDPFGGRS